MKKYSWKNMTVCAAAVLALGTAGFAQAAPEEKIGMPNPIVTYASYQQAAKAAGFRPLFMTLDSGYACDYISVIGKTTADLGFAKLGAADAPTNLRVRTALKKAVTMDNISGIYGAKWETAEIDGVKVQIAELERGTGKGNFAASWQTDKYLFSAQAENMEAAEFRSVLANSLVADAVHYF